MQTNDDTLRDNRRAALARTADRPTRRPRRSLVGAGIAKERGAALVEFALVLPVLAVLLFGMLEFGKLFNYWIDETHLTAEGARWAVVNNVPSGSSLQQYILDQADSAELHGDVSGTQRTTHGASVNICFYRASDGSLYTDPASATVGDTVEVVMKYDYQWLRNFPFPGDPSTTITGRSAMRLEALPTNYTPANNLGGVACPSSA
jgi:Flp pilus assembly protein TadG